MRILFVVPYIPSRIRVRSYNIIRTLAALGHGVQLVALQPPEDRAASIDGLRSACAAIDVFPLSRARTLWNGLAALPTTRPLQAAYSHHPAAERHVRELVASGRFDLVHVEHLRGSLLAAGMQGVPIVFDSVDSITYLFEQASRCAPRLRQRMMARADLGRTRRFEARAPFRFDRVLVTSPIDRQAMGRYAGAAVDGRIVVIPNGVDLDYFQPSTSDPEPATILFSGKLSYHANAAAALYLGREVMPLVWQACPEAKVSFVGKGPGSAIRALAADPRVEVTGYVEDMRPYFARATVAATPLLYGAGTQYKALEAMASGVPVVATARVVAGLQAEAGRDLLVGDSARALAEQIVRVIRDAALRRSLAAAGRRYVERCHDLIIIWHRLVEVYEAVADRGTSARP